MPKGSQYYRKKQPEVKSPSGLLRKSGKWTMNQFQGVRVDDNQALVPLVNGDSINRVWNSYDRNLNQAIRKCLKETGMKVKLKLTNCFRLESIRPLEFAHQRSSELGHANSGNRFVKKQIGLILQICYATPRNSKKKYFDKKSLLIFIV